MKNSRMFLAMVGIALLSLSTLQANTAVIAEYLFTSGSDASTGPLGSTIGFGAGITDKDTGFFLNDRLEIQGIDTTGTALGGMDYTDIDQARIATGNWVTFTITVPCNQEISLTRLDFDYSQINPAQFLLGFYTSKTGFLEGDHLLGLFRNVIASGTFTDHIGTSLDLAGIPSLQNLTGETVEFRFLIGDDSGATSRFHVLDNIVLNGNVEVVPWLSGLVIRSNGPGYNFEWPSEPGKMYDLLTSSDLVTPVCDWPVYGDGDILYQAIPSAGSSTTLTAVPSPDPRRFFAIRESDAPPPPVIPPSSFGIECEDFQFTGNWTREQRTGSSAGYVLSSSNTGAATPAATAVTIPGAGRYTLWVRSTDFPDDRVGQRNFRVAVGGITDPKLFGTSGLSGWTWERGGSFDLAAGPVLIAIYDNDGIHFARADALILTPDADFTPEGTFEQTSVPIAEPLKIDFGNEPVKVSEVTHVDPSSVAVQLANEHFELAFIRAWRDGKPTVVPVMRTRWQNAWQQLPMTPSAESYQVLTGVTGTTLLGTVNKYHVDWNPLADRLDTIEVGGVSLVVANPELSKNVVWDAGDGEEFIPREARLAGENRIELDFHRGQSGEFTAVWELRPGERSARVTLGFVPDEAGQYSLGYFPPFESGMDKVTELLLPPVVNRRRFPSESFTVVSGSTPTPVALMELMDEGGPLTVGVAAAAEAVPQDFPKPVGSRFGLHIRNPRGLVQPSIYGPLVGTPSSQVDSGETVTFPLHLLANAGGWYDGYRIAADEIYGWHDYRQNGQVSFTDAVLNMIDLYMDDEFGGWWEAGKGFYQIEGRNSVTHSVPLLAPSLYRLTGNRELYERRTRPTLAYMLSRNSVHFSPVREGARPDMLGSMRGPVGGYGTTVFGSLDLLLDGRMPVFREIALPGSGVRGSPAAVDPMRHKQPFDEWLGRYLLTGEQSALQQAIASADQYIGQIIENPPTGTVPLSAFFLLQYTPAWEGLLLLYETTGETRFLDAAAFGARQVMTGMWTQPAPKSEAFTIHPGGTIAGDQMDLRLYKGSNTFRLGFPIQPGTIVEKQVPEWLVSPVGLGLEQPTTYSSRDNGGRLILQSNWAPGFLRLAHHTGDAQFATYARNAAVGRGGNYPGYYYTTHTDLAQDPRYPLTGPDVGFFYYHHLPVHLTWSIDYLVSDAFYQSGGAVRFPGLRQFDYAYFDNLVYGHAPGAIFGQDGAWLWFRRGLVELDNPQANYLTAHDGNSFHVVLMNQSHSQETVRVRFHPAEISPLMGNFATATLTSDGGRVITLDDQVATIELPPRGLVALRIDGLEIDVPTHRQPPAPGGREAPGFVSVVTAGAPESRGASLQATANSWDAYIWSTALPAELQSFAVEWSAGGKSGLVEDQDGYPFELMIPVEARTASLEFRVLGVRPDGTAFTTGTHSLGVAR